jgi:hypothetical protein
MKFGMPPEPGSDGPPTAVGETAPEASARPRIVVGSMVPVGDGDPAAEVPVRVDPGDVVPGDVVLVPAVPELVVPAGGEVEEPGDAVAPLPGVPEPELEPEPAPAFELGGSVGAESEVGGSAGTDAVLVWLDGSGELDEVGEPDGSVMDEDVSPADEESAEVLGEESAGVVVAVSVDVVWPLAPPPVLPPLTVSTLAPSGLGLEPGPAVPSAIRTPTAPAAGVPAEEVVAVPTKIATESAATNAERTR